MKTIVLKFRGIMTIRVVFIIQDYGKKNVCFITTSNTHILLKCRLPIPHLYSPGSFRLTFFAQREENIILIRCNPKKIDSTHFLKSLRKLIEKCLKISSDIQNKNGICQCWKK